MPDEPTATGVREAPHLAHQQAARSESSAAVAVLTISDTRTAADDRSGDAIVRHVEAAGHHVAIRRLVRDEPMEIRVVLDAWIADPRLRVILTTGGTGIARRDTTIEVVRSVIDLEIDGFGELFRMLSFADIGASAMLSRALAGLVRRGEERGGDTFIFAMPGSLDAVTTAMEKLIATQLRHLLWLRRAGTGTEGGVPEDRGAGHG